MMDLSIEIDHIKVGTFRHIDLAPPCGSIYIFLCFAR